MGRYRVIIEFNQGKLDDMQMYSVLSKFSNPGAVAKDMLKGLLPLPGQIGELSNQCIQKSTS